MSKTNYINYQEVLKDGNCYEINSYSKTKKLFKSICGIIKEILQLIPALLYILLIIALLILMYISCIALAIGLLMVFVNFIIGVIMLVSSSIAILILAPIIEFLMC